MKSNFAYFTGTNRIADVSMAASMLVSARTVGVEEDFHLFSPVTADGFIHHAIPATTPWRDHMTKLDLLRKLADTDYEYLVWLDSDCYFVRHPGDLRPLIRSNKCWVSMESDLTSPQVRRTNWWGMKFPEIVDLMRGQGCGQMVSNTNGGMWICRRESITEFADRCESVFAALSPGRRFADEPPLAVAGATMVPDPEKNTIEHSSDTWAVDWAGRVFGNRIPHSDPWLYEDWLTGVQRTVNPAIIHTMGAKNGGRCEKEGKRPVVSQPTMTERIAQNVAANPCRCRSEAPLRIEKRQGDCSLGDAPVFICSASENKAGEASLWPFCSSQAMPCCRKCEWNPIS